MKCYIVEDELPAVKVIESHVSHFPDLQIAAVFHTAMEVIPELQRNPVDLIFLDINLPQMSGIQLLKTLSQKPAIILTTAHRDFAIEAYQLEVTDYLLKPISLDRFAKAIGKVYKAQNHPTAFSNAVGLEINTQPDDSYAFVKSDREHVKVILRDIISIESIRNHAKITTTQGVIITLMTLSELESKLPKHLFKRIHRSYLIGINHVTRFSSTNVTLYDQIIPIGGYYKQAFMQAIKEHML